MTRAIYTIENKTVAFTTNGHPYYTETDPVYMTENLLANYVTFSVGPYLLEDSTIITFSPSPPFVQIDSVVMAKAPIAAGTTVGSFVISPSGWTGQFVLGGPSAFKLSGNSLVTVAPLTAGTYNLLISVTE